MKLWQYIKEKMTEHLNQTLAEDNFKITYREVIAHVESFSREIKREKCCAVICPSEMMAAAAILSCFCAGVTCVPVSIRYGGAHCRKILKKINPTAIICDNNDGVTPRLRVIRMGMNIDVDINIRKKSYSGEYKEPPIHPALIMCTSGTTGTPKGVMLSEKNILANVNDICDYFKITSQDTILIARPLYHCAVLTGELLTGLVKGVRIHFFSGQFNPKSVFDLMENAGVTVFCATPTLFSVISRLVKGNASLKLKHITVSGECLSAVTGRRIAGAFPDADIYHVYGLTEAGPRVSYLPPDKFLSNTECAGRPLHSISVKIVKPDGRLCSAGEAGTLWVKGPSIMLGYYNEPTLTKQVLQNGWLCTKDTAFIDDNGFINIRGRADDMIIRSGMNIYPQEIENTVKQDMRVNEVHVYGFKGIHDTTQIGMDISGDFAGVSDVKNLCLKLLPAFQIPSRIRILDELPKNESGKIIRG